MKRNPRSFVRAVLCMTMLGSGFGVAQAQIHIDKIAVTGEVANLATGEVFGSSQAFDRPRLNVNGEVVFTARTSSGKGGVWTGFGGAISKIALQGDIAQSARGSFALTGFSGAIINDSGTVAFTASDAIVTRSGGSLAAAVRGGDAADGGGTYQVTGAEFSFSDYPRLDGAGRIAARLPVLGVPSDRNLHGVVATPGNAQAVMRKGQVVGSGGPTIGGIGVYHIADGPVMSANVGLVGSGVDGSNDAAIVVSQGAALSFAVREGDFLPSHGGFNVLQIRDPFSSNHAGKIALASTVTGQGKPQLQAILAGQPGAVGIVALQGDSAPGFPTTTKFTSFSSPSMASNGDLAFFSYVGTQGVWGLFKSSGATTNLITKSAAIAPGTGGAMFSDDLFSVVAAINSQGAVAFDAHLSDGTRGIFGADASGNLVYVAAEGRLLQVGPGDFRRVTLLRLGQENNAPQVASDVFNDQGQVAFLARFDDGTEGVFRATIPAPASGFVLLTLLMGPSRRRCGARQRSIISTSAHESPQ